MILKLKHEPVGGGLPQFASEVDAGRHIIGRDDQNSLVLDIESVSREHGCFFDARGRWFFIDLGSTNGSWVNGIKASPTNVRLLREGDLVQLANVAIRVTFEAAEGDTREIEEVPSLFVFREGEFQMEFPLAASSSRISLADLQGYLALRNTESLPAMTVNFRPGKLEIVVATDGVTMLVNGVEWGGNAGSGRTLYDRDELDSGSIKIVICDLATAKVVRERQIKAALASLPPAPGMPGSPSSGGASQETGFTTGVGYSPEATQALPRVSSQSEPSATIGSGSGLFGGGRPASGPASATEGRMAAGPSEAESDAARRRSPQQQRYVFGQSDADPSEVGGNPGLRPRGPVAEVGNSRFGSLPPPDDDEEDSEQPEGKTYAVIGAIALFLIVILLVLLFSMFKT